MPNNASVSTRDRWSAGAELFTRTVEELSKNYATLSIPEKLKSPEYDREFAHKICAIMNEICTKRQYPFTEAVRDFVRFCYDYLRLQLELEKTGSYSCKSFEEARKTIYENAEVMSKKYMNGLLLSQAFWFNHFRILYYFFKEFCPTGLASGKVLEVPVGTGIFISEFMERNPAWSASACDISKSSLAFASDLVKITGVTGIRFTQQNIFDFPESEKYGRIICGELLEHLDEPVLLLEKLARLLAPEGELFLTTVVWAASTDHVYLFKSAQEIRDMLTGFFEIKNEAVMPLTPGKGPEDEKTPINYACVLTHKKGRS